MNVIIILAYALERLIELAVSAYNKRKLEKEHNQLELFDKREAIQMRFFHIMWFLALLVESTIAGRMNDGIFLYIIVLILILAQVLRWTCIFTLGKYWSVDVYDMQKHPVVTEGPYAHIKHPNYLAVVTEFFFLPILLGCEITMIVGSVINFFMLKRRIEIEEQALLEQSLSDRENYHQKFRRKGRFVPLSHG